MAGHFFLKYITEEELTGIWNNLSSLFNKRKNDDEEFNLIALDDFHDKPDRETFRRALEGEKVKDRQNLPHHAKMTLPSVRVPETKVNYFRNAGWVHRLQIRPAFDLKDTGDYLRGENKALFRRKLPVLSQSEKERKAEALVGMLGKVSIKIEVYGLPQSFLESRLKEPDARDNYMFH